MAHFGLGENRILRGDGDVGVKRQPAAAAHGPTSDRADDRFGHLEDTDELDVVGTPIVHQIRGAHAGLDALGPLDIAPPAAGRRLIETGAESPSGAGDHYGADLGIGFGAVEGMVQFFQHRPGDRIERLGTVQRDEHAAALLFVFDFFVVGH